jgi:hypothetical protein
VRVVADDPGGEAVSEQVSPAIVALVETLGVHADGAVHAGRERGQLGLEEGVEVRAQDAPSVHLHVEAGLGVVQSLDQQLAVAPVPKGDLAVGGAARDLENAERRKLLAGFARHVFSTVCGRHVARQACSCFGTNSARSDASWGQSPGHGSAGRAGTEGAPALL